MTNFNLSDIHNDGLVPLYVNKHGIDGYCDLQACGVHVMQFTGLLDNNGAEIYEGDVVTGYCCDYEGPFEVFFHEGTFSVKADESYFPCLFECSPEKNVEVIGNIYENPELLTEDGEE